MKRCSIQGFRSHEVAYNDTSACCVQTPEMHSYRDLRGNDMSRNQSSDISMYETDTVHIHSIGRDTWEPTEPSICNTHSDCIGSHLTSWGGISV